MGQRPGDPSSGPSGHLLPQGEKGAPYFLLARSRLYSSPYVNWSFIYVYKSEYQREYARPSSPLVVGDLCAQLISLNRYGAGGLGAAVVEIAASLAGALRNALRFACRHTFCAGKLA